ncbi:MAG: hypothetical protein P0Y53_04195 [Candidatus Pseudobacter hemicellulosilyticus]|uniref:Beta-lactamase-inhibitor-like PepSY-like domain-containing protein n=1 Tax=Candidatus Pseudobacter hemicellulosilyticus TaxID=3121375 RepID=A0AAJ6BIB3_9BACT|nr:MAG: hypothetical protein P0Y53_04195 [Pseudobacter sp.]
MKKVFFIVCTMLFSVGVFADPNEKVLKSFKETFANAEEVKWQEYDNYFTVSFVTGDIRSKVNYDKDGNMLGSIRYYKPQQLPLNLFTRLKKEFPKKSLFGVTEITTASNEVAYYVKMEDVKHWVTVKVDESGNCTVYEKYKKG